MIDLSEFENGDIFSPLQKSILNILDKNGPMTRSALVEYTKKPRTTVYDNLIRLQSYNLVKKFSRSTNNRGRPLIFFKLII